MGSLGQGSVRLWVFLSHQRALKEAAPSGVFPCEQGRASSVLPTAAKVERPWRTLAERSQDQYVPHRALLLFFKKY